MFSVRRFMDSGESQSLFSLSLSLNPSQFVFARQPVIISVDSSLSMSGTDPSFGNPQVPFLHDLGSKESYFGRLLPPDRWQK